MTFHDDWHDRSMEEETSTQDGMWPLDASFVSLTGLVLYVIFTKLRFDDPRWLYNSWTYAILVPMCTVAIALAMRNVASQYVQKSIQLGFMASVFVHLALLLVAVRWVIFPAFSPEAITGEKTRRVPVRRTVPDYVFQSPRESTAAPDWSEPIDAETTSRIVPEQRRLLPPLDQSASIAEVPQPRQPSRSTDQRFLIPRDEPTPSQPRPADEPSKLARRPESQQVASLNSLSQPTVPELSTPVDSIAPERADLDRSEPIQRTAQAHAAPALAMTAEPFLDPLRSMPSPLTRPRAETALPTIGTPESRSQPRRTEPSRTERALAVVVPAGSIPNVAIARLQPEDFRVLAPERNSELSSARSRNQSTSLSTTDDLASNAADPSQRATDVPSIANVAIPRAEGDLNGLPQVTATQTPSQRMAARRQDQGLAPAGSQVQVPDAATSSQTGDNEDPREITRRVDQIADQSGSTSRPRAEGTLDLPSSLNPSEISFDLFAPLGKVGLSQRVSPDTGVIPTIDPPRIAALDLHATPRPRRDVGGPVVPAGSQIASVESFNRRVMRTEGGAAQAPAGMVGPATEEAIERGLVYLAQLQNDDGSWSLQGHGEDVVLRSDTAATGLCLLAFQGAGYTHKQHQYAGVVAKGLEFLKKNQRTNGDLFRPENAISNRNVAFYSHGIAALATSEAYGMTQDPQLRETAQLALDYIAATQHRRRGGWRYTAQVSSDTSVSGWMMMALKSGELSGLNVAPDTYQGIERWLNFAQEGPLQQDRYRYDPFAPDTPSQRHGRFATPTMTAVGMLMRMYSGWQRDRPEMQSAAEYLLQFPPQIGTPESPKRDTYYWYYATQVMFHMGGDSWERWNKSLNPVLLSGQIKRGPQAGSWDPNLPVADRWSPHAGRLYVTAMNLLNLEVYYRHLPIYDDTGMSDQPE